MPREKEAYWDNLSSILEYTGGKHALNVKTVAAYLGTNAQSTKKRYPFKDNYISAETLARNLA